MWITDRYSSKKIGKIPGTALTKRWLALTTLCNEASANITIKLKQALKPSPRFGSPFIYVFLRGAGCSEPCRLNRVRCVLVCVQTKDTNCSIAPLSCQHLRPAHYAVQIGACIIPQPNSKILTSAQCRRYKLQVVLGVDLLKLNVHLVGVVLQKDKRRWICFDDNWILSIILIVSWSSVLWLLYTIFNSTYLWIHSIIFSSLISIPEDQFCDSIPEWTPWMSLLCSRDEIWNWTLRNTSYVCMYSHWKFSAFHIG